jgi:acyl carrier protein
MSAQCSRDQVETALLKLWSDVLETPVSDRDADFFDVGGDSFLATLLILKVSEEWRIELTTEPLIENPTVAEFASCVLDLMRSSEPRPNR